MSALPAFEPQKGPQQSQASARRSRRPKKIFVVREDDGEGNWLVSYADLMTLLFGFFVMLSAFSTPDAEKFERLRQATSKDMGVKASMPYEELRTEIEKVLKDMQLGEQVNVTETLDGVRITSQGTVFFDSGSAELKEGAQALVDGLSDVLSRQAKGFRIVVEGHTDDVPIASKLFPSNWELSSARAGSVVRLLEQKGLSRTDLRPVGLADTEPVKPNRGPSGEPLYENQAANRRIVIKIQRALRR